MSGDRPRRARVVLGLGTIGLLAFLLGAWGGTVPFIGPSFGYSADGTASWTWNLAHALLYMVPGAAAVLCGLVMMGRAPLRSPRIGGLVRIAALVTIASGAWFVIGPAAWAALGNSAAFAPASPLGQFANLIGYNLGPGVLLVLLGAMALVFGEGRIARETVTSFRPAVSRGPDEGASTVPAR